MARALGLTVVAEGIETEAQRDALLRARLPLRAGLPVRPRRQPLERYRRRARAA